MTIHLDDVRNWNIDILSGKATIEIPSNCVRTSILTKSKRYLEKMKTRSQQEPTIIINNYIHLNSLRHSYQSVQYGNDVRTALTKATLTLEITYFDVSI